MAQQVCFEFYLIFTALILLMAEILAQPEAKGVYLKREHSLAKPYHGKLIEITNFLPFPASFTRSSRILQRNAMTWSFILLCFLAQQPYSNIS